MERILAWDTLAWVESEVQGILAQLETQVRSVIEGARHPGRCRGPGMPRTPDPPVFGHLEGEFFLLQLATDHPGRIHDRVDTGLIPGAAAGIVVFLEPVSYLFAGRVLVLVQQALGGDDEPGTAVAALGAVVDDPGNLQGVQVLWGPDTFDGGDGRAFGHRLHPGDAGAYHLAVHNHRTGAALAFAAADFRPREEEILPQHVGKIGIGVDNDYFFHAVDIENFSNHVPPFCYVRKYIINHIRSIVVGFSCFSMFS